MKAFFVKGIEDQSGQKFPTDLVDSGGADGTQSPGKLLKNKGKKLRRKGIFQNPGMGEKPGIVQDIVRVGLDENLLSFQIIGEYMLINTFLFLQGQLPQVGELLGKEKDLLFSSQPVGQTEKAADVLLKL